MNIALFTLFEGSYHHGVAALLNSAIKSGFQGEFFAGYRDRIPYWALKLGAAPSRAIIVQGVSVTFFPCDPDRHLGYHKPFAAAAILEQNPSLDAVLYADPDVVFLCGWKFIREWLFQGVALCLDSNFAAVHENHPWRTSWKELIAESGHSVKRPTSLYVNSGYFGIARDHLRFIQVWIELTLEFERQGGDTRNFRPAMRELAIVTDQDVLAAVIMATENPLSILGSEGMGFNGHFFVLSHAIESPKPWDCPYIMRALHGIPPTSQACFYERFSRGPCRASLRWRIFFRGFSLFLAKFIGRFYKR